MQRREFLALCGAAALAGCSKGAPPLPPGELGGMNFKAGHRLWSPGAESQSGIEETRQVGVLIVGGGIAGLSAAWRLERAAYRDFQVLELEDVAGGNSRSGANAISAYPLGAHYLPLPNPEARVVRAMLADFGVLQGDPNAANPAYDETYLCHAPQERLYRQGIWQEGLVPRLGVSRAELDEQGRFFQQMETFRQARGRDGRRYFALPLAHASRDTALDGLDRLSMHDWMRREGYGGEGLHWYVNYACRDDYGTDYRQVSAWAGIHYFACRMGHGQGADDVVLTAPEGNGWLVKRLMERLSGRVQTGQMALRLSQRPGKPVEVLTGQAAGGPGVRYLAEHVIWAAPLFLLPRVVEGLPDHLGNALAPLSHAPWIVANLSLSSLPGAGAGAPLSWDNVLYDSPGLGYVVATHQRIRRAPGPTVLTYYRPLSELDPRSARTRLLEASRDDWAQAILADLSRAHGHIREQVSRLDVFRHGHAMARPLVGLMRDGRRDTLSSAWGRVWLAHGDVSGLSLFEEASHWGVRGAEQILSQQGAPLHERLA